MRYSAATPDEGDEPVKRKSARFLREQAKAQQEFEEAWAKEREERARRESLEKAENAKDYQQWREEATVERTRRRRKAKKRTQAVTEPRVMTPPPSSPEDPFPALPVAESVQKAPLARDQARLKR